jgi:glycosyltransferase involved in cell wall biosynthesis
MLRLVEGLGRSERVVPLVALTQKGQLYEKCQSHDELLVRVFPGLDKVDGRVTTYVRALRDFNRLLQDQPPLVALVQNRRLLLATAPVLRWHRVPMIWQIGLGFPGAFHQIVNRVAASLADSIVIESEKQAKAILSHAHREPKVTIVEKGVDFVDPGGPKIAEPYYSAPLRVGTVASISVRKRLDLLIEAAALAKDVVAELWIAGGVRSRSEERYLQDLIALADRCGAPPVNWMGWTDRIQDFYRSLDIFVLCSENEGISGALREAMSSGLPVITTRVGGAESLIEDNETGILVDRLEPASLAVALRKLARDSVLRQKIGQCGARIVRQRYSVPGFVRRYEQLLYDVALRKRGGRREFA